MHSEKFSTQSLDVHFGKCSILANEFRMSQCKFDNLSLSETPTLPLYGYSIVMKVQTFNREAVR